MKKFFKKFFRKSSSLIQPDPEDKVFVDKQFCNTCKYYHYDKMAYFFRCFNKVSKFYYQYRHISDVCSEWEEKEPYRLSNPDTIDRSE